MNTSLRIGLIGDHDPEVVAHRAIPLALDAAAARLGIELHPEWVPTESVTSAERVAAFDALWCVPASPYRSEAGALGAIRHARESRVPFLGTCGGFQHAVLEYARNVLGWTGARHAEGAPGEGPLVVAPLTCSLVEASECVRFVPGTRLARAYGALEATAGYHCRFGLNESLRAELAGGAFAASATDEAGDVRGMELATHPFFVATLFQPEREALAGRRVPLAEALLAAAAGS